MPAPVRIIHYGLGPIGIGIAQVALERGYAIVGAVDIDPQKAGHPLSEVVPGAGSLPIQRTVDSLLNAGADVVLHSTQSRIEQVMPQLVALLDAGLNIISTCEELAYPWYHHPKEAALLHELATGRGCRVVGLGVNPGFVMDALPVMLTAPCRRVDRIAVERVVDVGLRRAPLQRKVGVGLTVDAFRAGVTEGVIGHVGLPQSVAMIAAALGWAVDEIEETVEPEMDAKRAVRGLRQVCTGSSNGQPLITLDLTMVVGAERPKDAIRIQGEPSLVAEIPQGVHGDVATWALIVKSIPRVLSSAPGLLVPTQLALSDTAPPRGRAQP